MDVNKVTSSTTTNALKRVVMVHTQITLKANALIVEKDAKHAKALTYVYVNHHMYFIKENATMNVLQVIRLLMVHVCHVK